MPNDLPHDPMDEFGRLSRRMMLTGSAALGAVAAAPSLALAATGAGDAGPDLPAREHGIPADARARAAIVRRVRMRTDAGPVFWFFRGRNYAQQGARLIPLCELSFGGIMNVTPRADGGLDVAQYELGFRTALGSSKRAEKLLNPITGEMVDLPFAPVGPTLLHYDAENLLHLPPSIGGTSFRFEQVPEVFYHVGGQVCFQTHTRALAQTPGARDRSLNDMTMICSPAHEALNPRLAFASATGHGSDVSDYARWLRMPEGAGTQTLRSIGFKTAKFSDLPEDWRAMLAANDPAMAADPIGGLKRKAVEYRN